MIAFIRGILDAIEQDAVLVDVNGVGYRVYTPISQDLLTSGVGSEIKLYTYLSVREDAMTLYGFLDQERLGLFKLLISVGGIGPRSGLAFFSALSAREIVSAILSEDKKTLQSVPGIGAKTAGRIILDLKDKVSGTVSFAGSDQTDEIPGAPITSGSVADEAVMALVSLGYTQSEASKAVRAVISSKTEAGTTQSLEQIIRSCLKLLY
ncbi:MAG: Holliday junction branch migration protein RuvA [Firmicutes bacterium]|nr:Holliday junction branch migration protein RuvA [Bacillota bacterium]